MGGAWSRMARSLRPGGAAPRVAGYPVSQNRASSLHLFWELPAGTDAVTAASVELVVEAAPVVPDLYFWALQVSFVDGAGQRHGGGHLGLQWHQSHPGSRAVNWGGYGRNGETLDGSASPLPSATGNPNTRDLWWEPGEPHTLKIGPAAEGGWAGTVDGVRVRRLAAGGDRLERADGVVGGVCPLRRTPRGGPLVGFPGHHHAGTGCDAGSGTGELPKPSGRRL